MRIFWEVDFVSAFLSSTNRMRDIALRNGPLDWNAVKNEKRSADVTGSERHFCDGELNYQDVRKGVNR